MEGDKGVGSGEWGMRETRGQGDKGTRGENLQQVFPQALFPMPNAPFPNSIDKTVKPESIS